MAGPIMHFEILMLVAAFAAPVLSKFYTTSYDAECEYLGTTNRCAMKVIMLKSLMNSLTKRLLVSHSLNTMIDTNIEGGKVILAQLLSRCDR
jgi:hypothetical protein